MTEHKHNICYLRNTELNPELAAKIWPFINAYREHDPVPTWRDFKEDGIDRIEEESLLEIIVDQYEHDQESVTACEEVL